MPRIRTIKPVFWTDHRRAGERRTRAREAAVQWAPAAMAGTA